MSSNVSNFSIHTPNISYHLSLGLFVNTQKGVNQKPTKLKTISIFHSELHRFKSVKAKSNTIFTKL